MAKNGLSPRVEGSNWGRNVKLLMSALLWTGAGGELMYDGATVLLSGGSSVGGAMDKFCCDDSALMKRWICAGELRIF